MFRLWWRRVARLNPTSPGTSYRIEAILYPFYCIIKNEFVLSAHTMKTFVQWSAAKTTIAIGF